MEEAQKTEEQKTEPKTDPKVEVKEIHHHHHHYYKGPNFGRILAGVILLVAGISFLARSLGWVHFDFVLNWDIIWPLLIIMFGLAIVSRGGWFVWVVSIVVILVVVGILCTGVISNGTNSTTVPISIEKQVGSKSVDVSVDTGAGKLVLSGGSDKAVTGSYFSHGQTVSVGSSPDDTKQIVSIQTKGSWMPFGVSSPNSLNIQLASGIPTRLTIHTGASEDIVDLTAVQAERIDISTGASSLALTLGDTIETSSVSVEAGASSIAVTLPKTLGARLHIESGLTSKALSNFTKKDETTYESSNYSTSTHKVDFSIKTGASSITFNWK